MNEQNLENSITLGNRILLALETPPAKSVLDLSTAGRQLGSVHIRKYDASKTGVLEAEKANRFDHYRSLLFYVHAPVNKVEK